MVGPGETLLGIAHRYKKSVREVATANQLQYDHPLKIGDKLIIPGVSVAKAPPAPAQQVAAATPQTSARMLTPAAPAEQTATASSAAPQFRWPVRGRVISGFGPMTNGQQNDGINLAVPEGTAIRAAEDGVSAAFHTQALEIPELREFVRARFCDGEYPQIIVRLGVAAHLGESIRRPAEEMIRPEP